jgi:hypothetical protein
MSVPAGLMQALQQGGAGGPGGPGGPAGGPPPSIQIGGGPQDAAAPGQSDGPDNPNAEQDLHDALDALQKFMSDEEDHVDKATVAKCIAQIQSILGSRQKGAESALGVTDAHKAMSRSY